MLLTLAEILFVPFSPTDIVSDGGDAQDTSVLVLDGSYGKGDVEPGTVFSHTYGVEALDLFAACDLAEDLRHLVQPLGRNQHGDVLSDDLVGGITVHLLGSGIPGDDCPISRPTDDGIARGHHNGSQLRINSFGLLAFGDIAEDSVGEELAVLLECAQGAIAHPDPVSVLVPHTILEIEDPAFQEKRPIIVFDRLKIVRVDMGETESWSSGECLGGSVAEHVFYIGTDVGEPSLGVHCPGNVRKVSQQPAVLLLALAEIFVGLLAFGDIAENAIGEEDAIL